MQTDLDWLVILGPYPSASLATPQYIFSKSFPSPKGGRVSSNPSVPLPVSTKWWIRNRLFICPCTIQKRLSGPYYSIPHHRAENFMAESSGWDQKKCLHQQNHRQSTEHHQSSLNISWLHLSRTTIYPNRKAHNKFFSIITGHIIMMKIAQNWKTHLVKTSENTFSPGKIKS